MSDSPISELDRVGVQAFTAGDYRPGPVVHIVLFRFADSATTEQRDHAIDFFRSLIGSERNARPYIESISGGAQESGEEGANEFEYGFIVRFRSVGDRNYYVGEPLVSDPDYYDPQHAAFKREVGPLLRSHNGVQVLDFLEDVARTEAPQPHRK